MNLAGKATVSRAAVGSLTAIVLLITNLAPAQQAPLPAARRSAVFTPVPVPTQTPSAVNANTPVAARTPAVTAPVAPVDHQSSLTVQQIVARQEDHFAKIKNAQGIVVHTETRYNEQGQPQTPITQNIFFAYEGNRSVTLTMPAQAASIYRGSRGQIPWKQITSAYHVTGDTVYVINKPEGGTSAPTVLATSYNPAIHENNPLVAFHPRQVSDETLPLRDLAGAIPNMQQRPTVVDTTHDGKPMVRIDFGNPKVPGERLYYIIDPARGYLPVEITRASGTQALSVSKIVIGHTPDGTWIPAKRERIMYDGKGRGVSRQTWEYDYLAVNQGLAPKTLSLMYFNLPLSTKVSVVGGKTTGAAKAPAQPASVTPTPIPALVAQTPMSVRLP